MLVIRVSSYKGRISRVARTKDEGRDGGVTRYGEERGEEEGKDEESFPIPSINGPISSR